jgi:maltokinase
MMATVTQLDSLGSDGLLGLLSGRRWFAAAELSPESASLTTVVHADEQLELALVDVRFAGGTRRTYLLAVGPDGEEAMESLPALARLAGLAGLTTPCLSARAVGVEQSNSSAVLDESVVLKLYRRLETGPSPEVELLRALEADGFASAPRIQGVVELADARFEATLAVATEFIPSAGAGWELTLASLASGDAGWLPARARRLGEVTGSMHAALADASGPGVAPEEAATGSVAALAGMVDDEIAGLAGTPVDGRIPDLRDLVRRLADAGPPGLVLRSHGDYHLGQVLGADSRDWVVIDFEGEPGRSLAERRRRGFALSDVAGMLRSFAYAAHVSSLVNGVSAPAGWEASCRAAFMDGWRATVDRRLLPELELDVDRLLTLLELQKLVYELQYELANRPAWVAIPVAELERMLGAAA